MSRYSNFAILIAELLKNKLKHIFLYFFLFVIEINSLPLRSN